MESRKAIQVLEDALADLYKEKELTAETTRLLYSVLLDTLLEAIHIVENHSVIKMRCKSGRFMYRVSDLCLYPDEKRDEYERDVFNCMLTPRFCSCSAFFENVIIKQDWAMCRHSLAVVLSDALNIFELEEVEDESFAERYYSYHIVHEQSN